MNETIKKRYNEIKNKIDEYLDKSIEIIYPDIIYESMRYSLLAPGKRLRPVMAIEMALSLGAKIEEILPCACAIEMLHCQSLIHDDLPCMDNDDYRRGKLSNHKAFNEAIATLAGDAFLSFAPKLIINNTPETISKGTILSLLNEFFIAAGVDGIISGQIVDIDSENKNITKDTLNFIYEYKTSKLFQCAIRSGCIIAGVDNSTLNELTLFAKYYGHAFQIYDDILDVTSSLEILGKTPNKDEKSKKSTFVSMYGIKEAQNQVVFLCNKACDILKKESIKSEILMGIVSDMITGVVKCC